MTDLEERAKKIESLKSLRPGTPIALLIKEKADSEEIYQLLGRIQEPLETETIRLSNGDNILPFHFPSPTYHTSYNIPLVMIIDYTELKRADDFRRKKK